MPTAKTSLLSLILTESRSASPAHSSEHPLLGRVLRLGGNMGRLRGCFATIALLATITACGHEGEPWSLSSWAFPVVDATPSTISSQTDRSRHLAWGDYDTDGDLDLAIANGTIANPEANRLYENVGGVLTSVWTAPQIEPTYSVAWGDWDGDGDLDLAVGNASLPLRVYENDAGTLTSAWTSSENMTLAYVAWGDWDGDGFLDLGASGVNEPVRVYENNGSAPWLPSSATWSSSEADETRSIAWVDVDMNGFPDLSVANNNTSQPDRLYMNSGGALALSGWSPSTSLAPQSHAWADVDVDGDLDLAQAVNNGTSLLWINDAGSLTSSVPIAGTGSYIHNGIGAWADWDGDGDPDLAMPHYSGEPNQVFQNDGGTLGLAMTSSITDETRAAAWGDLDGDGAMELAVASGDNQQHPNRIHDNIGIGLDPDWLSGDSDNGWGGAWGDFDGDGDLDLAVANNGQANEVYVNDGLGDLTSVWTDTDSEDSTYAAWIDFDCDGDLDLAVANNGQPNRVYCNDPVGSLTSCWASTETDNSMALAWADLDDDDDLDLAVANKDGQPNRLYFNDCGGGGLETTASIQTSLALESYDLAWGDLDCDTNPDLAVANRTQQNQVYEYDSSTGSLTVIWDDGNTLHSEDIDWGDWDGDGDLDLAVANDFMSNSPTEVWSNGGSGGGCGGAPVRWTSAELERTSSVAWGDWDGDGDLDLAAGSEYDPERVYENTGAALSLAWSSDLSDPVRDVQWADVDSDGDLDLIAISHDAAEDRLYLNHRITAPILTNNPTYPVVGAPGTSQVALAGPYSAEVLTAPVVTIPFTLYDAEYDSAPSVRLEFSTLGGGEWFGATLASTSGPTEDLAAAPEGIAHTLDWEVATDGVEGDRVATRLVVEWQSPSFIPYPIQHGEVAAGSPTFRVRSCSPTDFDGDGSPCHLDCDDADPLNFPGNTETCDGQDNDCGGDIDEGFDADADGVTSCGPDGTPSTSDDDCDDSESLTFPGATEQCDGADNDCDGAVPADEVDGDTDGFMECEDCDDTNVDTFPGAAELCDGQDNDCNLAVPASETDDDSDGTSECEGDCDDTDASLNTADLDADGVNTCDSDCDDTDPLNFPGNPEVCDGQDNDCDLAVPANETDDDLDGTSECEGDCDDTDASLNTADEDADGVNTCDDDCDDDDSLNYPDNPEVCDGQDNDCFGGADADLAGEVDGDSDGSLSCDDCDDADPDNFPGNSEVCDGQDNDCSGAADLDPAGEVDLDSDDSLSCDDCDDADPLNFPDNTEVCDGQDNDCDLVIPADETDDDSDGTSECEGDCDDTDASLNTADEDADGVTTCNADCDDADPLNFPTNEEVCDGQDNDCIDGADADPAGEVDGDSDGSLSCDDCDDADPLNFPGNPEVCDGQDNDCDLAIPADETDDDSDGTSECEGDCDDTDASLTPADVDGDGVSSCEDDCDDANPATFPGNPEVCDGQDNDCDGLDDFANDGVDGAETDLDGDGVFDCLDGALFLGSCDCSSQVGGRAGPAAGLLPLIMLLLGLRRRKGGR
jgi:hypothetical protein